MTSGNAFLDRFRNRNLEVCMRRVKECLPCADHVIARQVPAGDTSDSPGTMYLRQDGPFHKTRLMDMAVRGNPGYDGYVMVDADLYMTEEVAEYIVKNVGDAGLVFPFGDTVYMDEVDTVRMSEQGDLWPGEKDHGVLIHRQTGLCVAFTRAGFDAVGGFDEAFTGWGAEDDAFMFKFRRMGMEVRRNPDRGAVAYHMFHRKVNDRDYLEGPDYRRNRVYCACIRRMSPEDFGKYLSGESTLDSLVEKYTAMGRLEVELRWQVTPMNTLKIDTTLYDIDRCGPMTIGKILDEVEREDGPEGIVWFVDTIFRKLQGIPEGMMAEVEARYGEAKRCLS